MPHRVRDTVVIASEAKQSSLLREFWIASSQGLLAMTAGYFPRPMS
jgi:hypothetical protein